MQLAGFNPDKHVDIPESDALGETSTGFWSDFPAGRFRLCSYSFVLPYGNQVAFAAPWWRVCGITASVIRTTFIRSHLKSLCFGFQPSTHTLTTPTCC